MDASEGRVLVIGATGALGAPLARSFARRGRTVRLMARDAARLAKAFPSGFEHAAGDATDETALARALDGCSGVHVSVAHGADEAKAVEVASRVARRLGVGRISYVSGTSVCEANAWFPMVAGKLRAERVIEASGVPFTIFRPTWFMEALENFFKHGRAVCFGRGAVRLRFVASDDFAELVPRAYETDAAAGRGFRVLGPAPIALYDALDRCRAALHPEIGKVTRLPFPVARLIAFLRGGEGAQMRDAAAFVRYFEGSRRAKPSPRSSACSGGARPRSTRGSRRGAAGSEAHRSRVRLGDIFPDLDARAFLRAGGRLGLALLLGGVIGWERERHHRWAGLRTHILLTLGCAALMLLAEELAGGSADRVRAIQGVAAGIGFLGGGAILKLEQDRRIEGLTTASGIWATAAIGLAAGAGRLPLAVVSALATLVVLSVLRWVERRGAHASADAAGERASRS